MLTMSAAAGQTGLSKSTIHRAIKSGKLSAHRLEDGSYEIDPAELFRVYRPTQPAPGRTTERYAPPSETGEMASGTEWDAVEAHLRELLEIERRRGDELRQDRDAWRAQAERLALMPPTPEIQPPPRGGLFAFFRRRAA